MPAVAHKGTKPLEGHTQARGMGHGARCGKYALLRHATWAGEWAAVRFLVLVFAAHISEVLSATETAAAEAAAAGQKAFGAICPGLDWHFK